MLYKRVKLGITLNATALVLALLSLEWQQIPSVIYDTTVSLLTIAIVLATFAIMFLSQLYKETGYIERLSTSLSKLLKSPKIVLSLLPAIIGFLPVAGGALMSAPIVDIEGEKLKLKPDKKSYVNIWFRHTIFPIYPVSQLPIVASAFLRVPIYILILRQIPVVIVMVTVGYFFSFWRVSKVQSKENSDVDANLNSNLKSFLISFLPILTTILVVVFFGIVNVGLPEQNLPVLIATLVGIAVLIAISRASLHAIAEPLKNWAVYDVTLAAYGAFLLRNTIIASGINNIFQELIASGSLDITYIVVVVPIMLGFLTGSPLTGISISAPLLPPNMISLPNAAAMIYIGAFLGYVIAPTHLCFAFTADYFKSPIEKIYKYLIPSFLITIAAALVIYFKI
ncbi:MAG: DUF401 family protein [Candidatus Bathyarchaeia archaeon]